MIEIVRVDYQNPDHISDLIALMDQYALDPMGGGEGLADKVKANLGNELARLPSAISLLAYVGNEAVGLVNAFEGFSTFACQSLINVHDVIVSSAHRRKGISHLLLSSLENIAKEKACCKLTLEVLSQNKTAKASYQKMGFAPYQLDPKSGQAEFWQKNL